MPTYKLKFLPVALKEWNKLDAGIRKEFKKKLEKRITEPEVPSAKLVGHKDVYKIKLRSSGYRLAYQVINNELVILVIAVGKREQGIIYQKMDERLS
ncbi:MAG: type II toxin-antitoxin system RelE/ParE family toxin [Spirochaetales bacterium]|nr:type II toxin-antitoxin system RelE/ParE family toxin [Spirochaetales bacterium]